MNEQQRSAAWQAAGESIAHQISDGMRVGLGTGRSAAAAIRALGARVAAGLKCTGVPTSLASDQLAREVGITVVPLREPLDIAFDGADCVTPHGQVVKGAGGAMVRERIVADAAERFVVLVDTFKVASSLDAWGVLPVAVLPFAAERVGLALAELSPTRRDRLSDDGLVLFDCAIPVGSDWEALATHIRAITGVVDHGLFRVDPAEVIVGTPDGARTLDSVAVDGAA